MISLTILIPVYNNASTLNKLNRNIQRTIRDYELQFDIDILIVDDASTDRSFDVMSELKKKYSNIKLLQFAHNHSQLYSLYAALHYVNADYFIYVSADLQESNHLIHEYFKGILKYPEIDFFIGYREQNEDSTIYKLFSNLFYRIIRFKIPQIPIGGFDTACVSRALQLKFLQHYKRNDMIQAVLVQQALAIQLVPYRRQKSESEGWRWKSRLANVKYFIRCLKSVYWGNKSAESIKFEVKQYLE